MSNDDTQTLGKTPPAAGFPAPANTGWSLLVVSKTGMKVVTLPAGGRVVIGRADDCDVSLDDGKLSRRHAAVTAGERVEIMDLGSLNGTFLRELRLTPNVAKEIVAGDTITLGNAVLVLQQAPAGGRPRHVWSHGYFEARVEEECARAAEGAATFAVLRIGVDAQEGRGAALEAALAAWLRPTDILGLYAPGLYEVLLLKTTAEEADGLAADLRARLEATELPFELAVAAYPRDGRTPEELVSRAPRAAQARAPETPSLSGAMERMEPIIRRVAAATINVLVLGETGVGKEVLARTIHERSPRAKSPLVSINCAALSESLLESELFGHEKGAFTGAVQAKPGLLEAANGGSVFLDEVGEMPATIQAKLLRVLEQREVTRVGALKPRAIDVRFIAATNRDLEVEVSAGRFRQDLYFRLNGISLSLPPLRDRPDEIEPLARRFADEACRRAGRAQPVRFHPEALALLRSYQWPGNIRELKNVVERAVILSSGGAITTAHLPVEKMGRVLAAKSERAIRVPPYEAGAIHASSAMRPAMPTLPGADLPAGADEKTRIMAALEKCGGNQSQAAKMLGIARRTLINRIEEYGLPRPRKREI